MTCHREALLLISAALLILVAAAPRASAYSRTTQGAYLFEPFTASIRAKQELHWYDEAMLAATDPVGVLSSGVEKLTGRKPAVKIEYTPQQLQRYSGASEITPRGERIAISLQFPWK